MAMFYLKDFVSYNATDNIVAASWQISLTPDFSKIVDETIFDTENVLTWRSHLEIYGNQSSLGHDIPLYVRVKIYTLTNDGTSESNWFTAKEKPHKDNTETLTYKGKDVCKIKINEDGTYETIL